jgi:hypothetical protein
LTRHYSSEQWADYVRGATPARQSAEMERHLDAGCAKCRRAGATWKTVLKLARREAGYRPPDRAIRLAKSYFAMRRIEEKQSIVPNVARLVFDSFRQPQLAGVRSLAPAPRHYVYQSGSLLVDVWMDPAKESIPAILTGQVLDQSSPAKAVEEMLVKLRSGGADLAATSTNQFGEFHFVLTPAARADINLTIGESDRTAVLIPLKLAGVREGDDDE